MFEECELYIFFCFFFELYILSIKLGESIVVFNFTMSFLKMEVWLIYSVALASGVQPSDFLNLPANAGDIRGMDVICGSGRSPGGGQPTPVFLPEESHGQGCLAGYSP